MEEQRESQISYMWEEYEITPNSALSHRKEELNDRQEMKKIFPGSRMRSADLVL